VSAVQNVLEIYRGELFSKNTKYGFKNEKGVLTQENKLLL